MAMGNQKLKLWVLVIIFAFTALFAAVPSAQAKAGSGDFDFTDEINQVFTIFFKDIRKAYDNLFRSFEKMFEEMLADFERSLEEAMEEINGDIKNLDGKNINGDGGDVQKPRDRDGGDNANNNNDGNDGDQGLNGQNNGGQQVTKDDDFPNLEGGGGKDNNGSNGNISSGKNIGSNPWDILNKRAQKPQDDKTGRDPQKPQNQNTNNDNVNPPKPPQNNNNDNVVQQPQPPVPPLPPAPQPPVPQPPAPQPPVPPLPPNNNNQNVNNNFKDPFDEMIKQQNNQMNGNNTDKNNTVDNRPADAKELIKKIQEKFGVTIVDGEPPKYVWTPQELKTTFDILSELPLSFVRKTVTLAKGSAEAVFPGMSNIGGFASGSSITITPLGLNCDYRRVLIHEMGHCFHFQTYELQNQFQQKFWSGRNGYSGSAGGANPPAISQYGGSNVMEDMAEAIAYYVVYGKSMKQMSPERYELVKKLVMEGKEW
jgi:hypothetical protein